MDKTHYPRVGQRLAPLALGDALAVPVPRRLRRRLGHDRILCTLDAGVWDQYDEETCRELARAVLKQLQPISKQRLPQWVLARPVQPWAGLDLRRLGVSLRTRNRLLGSGFVAGWRLVGHPCVSDLLSLHGFGASCLLDLLVAVEELQATEHPVGTRSPAPCDPDPVWTRSPAPCDPDPVWTRSPAPCDPERAARLLIATGHTDKIRHDDPRFRQDLRQLGVEHSTLGEALRGWLDDPTTAPVHHDLASHVSVLLDKLRRATMLGLDEELADLAHASSGGIEGRILIESLGWDGRGLRTLPAITEWSGLTQQEVVQLRDRARARLEGTRPFAPILLRALARVLGREALPTQELEFFLVDQDLIPPGYRLQGLTTAARMLGYHLPPSFPSYLPDVPEIGPRPVLRGLRRRALDALEAAGGVAGANHIASRVSAELGEAITPRRIRDVLKRDNPECRRLGAGYYALSSRPDVPRVDDWIRSWLRDHPAARSAAVIAAILHAYPHGSHRAVAGWVGHVLPRLRREL